MLGVAVFYALLIGTGFCLGGFANRYSNAGLAYPVSIASFALAGAWSVMGVGNTMLRTLTAVSFATVVLLGLFSSFWLLSIFASGFSGSDNSLYWISALCFFTTSILVQIPFWLLRIGLGSHWCFEGNCEKPLISLRDMLFLILVFSLAISASQWASEIIAARVSDSVSVGFEVYRLDPESQEYGFEMVTKDNIEEMRENQLQNTTTQFPLLVALNFLIPTALTLPIFWWVFHCKRFLSSWALTMVYGMAISAAVLLLIFAVGGGGDLNFKMSLVVTRSVTLTSLLVWLPLVLLRISGLKLRTKRHNYSASPAN